MGVEKREEYTRKLEEIVRKFTIELEKEREKNRYGEKLWHEKSKTLKQDLETAVEDAVKLDQKNMQLYEENKLLRKMFKAQDGDRYYMISRNSTLKRKVRMLEEENKRLLEELKAEKAKKSPPYQRCLSPSKFATERKSFDEKKSEEIIEKLKKTIEQQRKHLK